MIVKVSPFGNCCGVLLVLQIACGGGREATVPTSVHAHPGAEAPTRTPLAWMSLRPNAAGEESALAGETIRNLVVGPSGDLWVSTDLGLNRLHGGRFQAVGRTQRLSHDLVLDMAATATGLVVATQNGLDWIDEFAASTEAVPLFTGRVRSVAVHAGFIWFVVAEPAAQNRVFARRLDDAGRPASLATRRGDVQNPGPYFQSFKVDVPVWKVYPGGPADLFCVDSALNLSCYRIRDGRLLSSGHLGPNESVRGALATPSGAWLLTSNRLLAVTGREGKLVTVSLEGVKEAVVLAPARDGALLATGQELLKVDLEHARVAAKFALPRDRKVIAVAETGAGRIWLGTERDLLLADPGHSRLLAVPQEPGAPADPFDGAVKAPAGNASSAESSGDRVLISQARPSKSLARTAMATFDARGNVWTGAGSGLVHSGTGDRLCPDYPVKGEILDALLAPPTLSWVVTWNGLWAFGRAFDSCAEPVWMPLRGQDRFSKEALRVLRDRDLADTLLDALRSGPIYTQMEQLAAKDKKDLRKMEIDDDLADWLLQYFKPAQLLGTSTPSILTALDDEAVVGLRSKANSATLLASRRNPTLEDIPFAQSTAQISAAAFDHANGRLVTLADDGSLLEIGIDPRTGVLEVPREGVSPFGDEDRLRPLQVLGTPPHASGSPVVASAARVWRMGIKRPAATEVELSSLEASPRILGILPDLTGRGALIGCWRCGGQNLFRGTADGTTSPLEIMADKIGCGNNAMLRDSRGRIWLSSEGGLFRSESAGKPFTVVPDPERAGKPFAKHINHMIEYPERSGWIWAVGGDKNGVWLIEDGQAPGRALELQDTGAALAAAPGGPAAGVSVWVGGKGILRSLDPLTRAQTGDYLTAVTSVLGPNLDVTGLAPDGDGVFVLTTRGAVRIAGGTPIRVAVPSWPSSVGSDGPRLAVAPDGRLVIKVNHREGTEIWSRPAGQSELKHVAHLELQIHTIAVDANGDVLMGDEGGRVYRLIAGVAVPLWRPNQSKLLTGKQLTGVCNLGARELLVMDDSSTPVLVRSSEGARGGLYPLPYRDIEPWTECAPLTGGQVLLRHATSCSLLNVHLPTGRPIRLNVGDGRPLSPLVQASGEGADRLADYAWLVDKDYVWFYHKGDANFSKLTALPRINVPSSGVHLAVDQGGAWLAIERFGVYRWTADPTRPLSSDKELWRALDYAQGLPADTVRTIVPQSEDSALFFTSVGLYRARRERDGWRCMPVNQEGVIGRSVESAALIRLPDRKILALGTDRGVSMRITRLSPDGRELSRQWWHDVVEEADVRAIAWSAKRGELFVAGNRGVAVYTPGFEGETPRFRKAAFVETSGQLGAAITQLQVSSNGDVWMVAGNRVARWRRGSSEADLVCSDPYLFQGLHLLLGPSLEGKAPELLVRGAPSGPFIWSLAGEAYPRVEHMNLLYAIRAEVVLRSLDPAMEQASWRPRFAVDRTPSGRRVNHWRLAPDLLRWPSPHVLVGKVEEPRSGRSYVIVHPLPSLEAGAWLARLAILLALVGVPAWYGYHDFRRRRKRAERLSAREVPYIVGNAVQGANFFGREGLIRAMRDSVAINSYALVGEYRIGKTSIQHELTRSLLEVVASPHRFLTVFVDLQVLPAGWDQRFFHHLGRAVLTRARDYGVPQTELAGLEFSRYPDPADHTSYTAQHLKSDVQMLLEFWTLQCAPREPILLLQIDEAGLMHNLSYTTLLQFRSMFVDPKMNGLHTVLSGRQLPPDEIGASSSPWSNFLKDKIEVRPLKPSEARELIVRPAEGLFEFEEDAIDTIIGLAQGRPMELQRLCANVVQYKYDRGVPRGRITRADVEASLAWAREHGAQASSVAAGPAEAELAAAAVQPKPKHDY